RTTGGGIRALASDSNTQNTSVFVAAILPDGVDLTATIAEKNPRSVVGGAKGSATVTVTNTGTQTAKGRVPITLYASSDKPPSTDDTKITTFATVQNLLPGKKGKAAKINFAFPASLNGNFFLLASVNDDGNGGAPTVTEVNLNNNTAAGGS